jgi:CRISPR-associated protein Cmr2
LGSVSSYRSVVVATLRRRGAMAGADLLVVALPGVQRFIAESWTTADVAAGSAIVSSLAAAMVSAAGTGVVFPAVDADTGAGVMGPDRSGYRAQWSKAGKAMAARQRDHIGKA